MINLKTEKPKILISRTDRLHDVILSFPMVLALRHKYPSAHISMLVHRENLEFAQLNPDLDEVLAFDPEREHMGLRGFFRLRRKIVKMQFDAVVSVFPRFKLAFLFWISSIPIRIGTSRRFFSLLYNVRVVMSRRKGKYHEIVYNIKLLLPFGIDHFALDEIYPRIASYPEAEKKFDEFIHKSGFASYLLIQPLPSEKVKLHWPLSYMEDLIYRILKKWGINVILIGTNKDEANLSRMRSKILNGNANFHIEIFTSDNLSNFIPFFSNTDLFISNFGGFYYLAALLGSSIVSFFPVAHGYRPTRYAPYGPSHFTLLTPDLESCENCTGEKCPHYNCLSRVSPEIVLEEAEQLMKKRGEQNLLYSQVIRKVS